MTFHPLRDPMHDKAISIQDALVFFGSSLMPFPHSPDGEGKRGEEGRAKTSHYDEELRVTFDGELLRFSLESDIFSLDTLDD